MTDRFTEATRELTEKNPYLFDQSMKVYGHPTIAPLGDAHGHGHRPDSTSPDCIFNCDPMPFGD